MDFAEAHERHLAAHRIGTAVVWCQHIDCLNHWEPVETRLETEYGQARLAPDECPLCGGGWLHEPPVHKCDSCHFTFGPEDERVAVANTRVWLCDECATSTAGGRSGNPKGGNEQ